MTEWKSRENEGLKVCSQFTYIPDCNYILGNSQRDASAFQVFFQARVVVPEKNK